MSALDAGKRLHGWHRSRTGDPGPIVITATFVGYQVAGLAGAVVGTMGIFLPSLFAVVLVDPWFSRSSAHLCSARRRKGSSCRSSGCWRR